MLLLLLLLLLCAGLVLLMLQLRRSDERDKDSLEDAVSFLQFMPNVTRVAASTASPLSLIST